MKKIREIEDDEESEDFDEDQYTDEEDNEKVDELKKL